MVFKGLLKIALQLICISFQSINIHFQDSACIEENPSINMNRYSLYSLILIQPAASAVKRLFLIVNSFYYLKQILKI